MMCTSYLSRKLWIFKIIIIYVNFLEFIDNKKIEKVIEQMMLCKP
jgi:hypothetical protein